MKVLLGVLFSLMATAFATIDLEISSTTAPNSDGFATFSFTPPASTRVRDLSVQILLPGNLADYSFKSCYNLANPNATFMPASSTTRAGYTTLSFARAEVMSAARQTFVCPIHTPTTADYRQVGIYLKLDKEDYFASGPGGTIVAEGLPLAESFKAVAATSYQSTPTKFTLSGLLDYNQPWTLRIGMPLNTDITVVVPVVFEAINPSPTCDVTYEDEGNETTIVTDARLVNGTIFVTVPGTNKWKNYVVTCHDFIFRYPADRTSVVEASYLGSNQKAYAWITKP